MREGEDALDFFEHELIAVKARPHLDLVRAEAIDGRGLQEAVHRRTRPSIEEALADAGAAIAPPRSNWYTASKRAIDITLAGTLIIVLAPVIALIAVLIRMDSKGSPFFTQERVGKGGRLFRFYKFRTMYVDAPERYPELYAYRFEDAELPELYFKLPVDPRCTRVGRRLRRTSLDELPNLFNVLRGDMSFVGPRPEIPQMMPYYEPEQLCKFAVKPGMTGLAQVSGRNILRFVETNAKDVEYVQNRSASLDLKVLFKTVGVVVLMMGAH
jgi:lipopolysaccharide/colanic/teichoic acid biosynthesis glycosyltransferase